MKKKLVIILCTALIISMLPTSSAFAASFAKAKSVSVSPTSMTIMVGDIAQLSATTKPAKAKGKLTWASSDNTVASVTSKGVVQGVSEGTATITVKTANKKTATCTVVVKNYIDENSIRESIKEDLKAEFATKNDIQSQISQNTYSKSEIDSKIADISSSTADACECTVKTAEDVVNILKQNTYTKEEIDAKLADISKEKTSKWEDGTEVALIDEQSLPITLVSRRDNETKITIDSITIKKYHNNNFIRNTFKPYKYTFEIKGTGPKGIDNASLAVTFLSHYADSYELRGYELGNTTDEYYESEYSHNDNSFTLKIVDYYMRADMDCFFVESIY